MTRRDATLEALAEARHDDPFGVLGPHVDARGVVVRACLPTADRVTVLRNGSAPVSMKRRHPAGIFEATHPRAQRPFPTIASRYSTAVALSLSWTIRTDTGGC